MNRVQDITSRPIKVVTSEESRERLRNQGYEWNGRMVLQHKCDWDYFPDRYQSNPKVEDFVLAYNEKHSSIATSRFDMLVKWRKVA